MTDLRADLAQWPLERFTVGRFGAYGAVRSNPREGGCGPRPSEPRPQSADDERRIIAARYPCTHFGADLVAAAGTTVMAPKDGWLLYLGLADRQPWIGYGPGVALIAHADTESSFWPRVPQWSQRWRSWDFPAGARAATYSLIGHLNVTPGTVPRQRAHVALPVDIWGSTLAKPNPTQWHKMPDGNIVMMAGAEGAAMDRLVHMGDELGAIDPTQRHIHWEIRQAPIAGHAGRADPIQFWREAYGLALPEGSAVAPPARARGGGAELLLLLALLAAERRSKKERR